MEKIDKELILKYALQNAVKYDGKPNPGAVIGHIISTHPELKSDMKSLAASVNATIKEIAKLGIEKQNKILEEKYPEMLLKKEKEIVDSLKELEGVDAKKGVIMRFAPSPSGPMHIGHAITGGLTSLYVEKYGGKFILRIEDTNSDNIYPPAYKQLPKDGEWIFGNVTDVWIQSDRIKHYYDYIERLLDIGSVYICTCSTDGFKEFVLKMQDCPCRALGKDEQHKRWKRMLDKEHGFKEGEAVVRFKSSMQDKNPAMRDFPLARINDSKHPRQGLKYRVWPLMNLSVFVDDVEAGMTHIIRAKDHADNAKRQEMIYKALGIKNIPKTYFVGRYNFGGMELSCSKTKARINSGEFLGFDDIRLPFLMALKRRGYTPQAFRKYTRLVGLSPVDKTISAEDFFKSIDAFNKEIIDPIAKRYFFIAKPVKVRIEHAPSHIAKLKLHPEHPEYGVRELMSSDKFFLAKNDFDELKQGKMYRLMDCLNFRKEKTGFVFDSKELEIYKEHGEKIMHWLPADAELLETEILMPDATSVLGFCEPLVKNVQINEVVQFERFGFCRLDRIKGKKLYFWYTHK